MIWIVALILKIHYVVVGTLSIVSLSDDILRLYILGIRLKRQVTQI